MGTSKKATKKASNKKVIIIAKNASYKKQNSKSNIKMKIFIGVAAVLIIVLTACLIIFCSTTKKESSDEIDFNQNVTNIEGTEFKPKYDARQDGDFSVRFTDLVCNENCTNVSAVKIGDKELKLGEDYEVKSGSIIIVIYKKVMQALQSGKTDITLDVEKDGKTITVGIHITISNAAASETQPTQEKQTEITTNNDSAENNSSVPTQGNNSTQQTPAEPISPSDEPAPTPTPTIVHTAEFNLNDGYKVKYFGVQLYLTDEEGNPIVDENNMLVDSFVYGDCEIMKGSTIVKKTYFTSNSHGISLEQREAEKAAVEARLKGGDGTGYTTDLTENYCWICGVTCDRW